jgi:hypothetical protein
MICKRFRQHFSTPNSVRWQRESVSITSLEQAAALSPPGFANKVLNDRITDLTDE